MIGPADRRTSPASGPLDRQAIAGVIGNVLEWYDFAVFGYFAPIIGRQSFPSDDHAASLPNAFGVFAAGYMMRPLGGIIFGSIGDRLGRKRALQLSIVMMALPRCSGCCPRTPRSATRGPSAPRWWRS